MTDAEKAAATAAAEAEAKATADAEAKAAADAAAAKDTETIGEVLDPKEPKPASKMVPEAALLDIKKDNKELKKELRELRESIEAGASKAEVSADLAAIGAKYDVKPEFLTELATAIRKEVAGDTDEKIKPLTAKDRADKIDKVFTTHFDKAMAEMPEFADIVNRDVIKSLSLDPANQNKTFAQLIEDTYGKALPGKRTLEPNTPRGGKSPDGIDYDRAKREPKYFDEIMSNADTKAEYNKGLVERVSAGF